MTANVPERQVRISRIAGRYLVFDIDDVVYIRRYHGVCAVLTGTMPQNPTQNLFLGLPVELRAEEAKLLVDKNVGYIADELSDHLSQLTSMDASTRKTYLQHLKQQRRIAQRAFDEEKARVQAKHQSKRKAANADKPAAPAPKEEGTPAAVEDETPSLFDAQPTNKPGPAKNKGKPKETLPAITPTTSSALLPPPSPRHPSSATEAPAPECASYPLYRYLNSRGYYTTPGLRFGGDLSVYPGDPFRYHAHYLANGYGWDEPVPMLDLVTSGRLGTAVKKSFLFGAEQPAGHGAAASASDENDNTVGEKKSGGGGGGEVRVFCIEWAGM